MEFWEVLERRKSTRRFLRKPVSRQAVKKILEAGRRGPSAGNLQAWRVVVVWGEGVKERLAEIGQRFLGEAAVVLVFCAVPEESGQRYGERGRELYSVQDATIACLLCWLAAVDLGLAGVWVGAFNEEKVSEILGLEQGWRPVGILPIGYGEEKPVSPEKKRLEELAVEK